MNKVLRVELTEEERQELDKYLINYPFGQISHILRHAVRDFIRVEKERESIRKDGILLKEAQKSGDQSRKGSRAKKT